MAAMVSYTYFTVLEGERQPSALPMTTADTGKSKASAYAQSQAEGTMTSNAFII